MVARRLLTLRELVEHWHTQPRTSTGGVPGDPHRCPVAVVLRLRHRKTDILVMRWATFVVERPGEPYQSIVYEHDRPLAALVAILDRRADPGGRAVQVQTLLDLAEEALSAT